jgi:excisionase family DNA binding protein
MPKDYYTTTEAAEKLAVSADTVLKWAKSGRIASYRTPGGHARIPREAVAALLPAGASRGTTGAEGQDALAYQYCWQFHAEGELAKEECLNCVAYRSRARRCYEMREIPEEFGHLRLHCQTTCDACDYYQLMHGRGTTALMLTRSKNLAETLRQEAQDSDLLLQFASSEYECAAIVEKFRPDFIVIDCSLGKSRTRELCRSLGNDDRIPFARIILASQTTRLSDCADGEIFGWIKKPFTYEQLKGCLGRPQLEAAQLANKN